MSVLPVIDLIQEGNMGLKGLRLKNIITDLVIDFQLMRYGGLNRLCLRQFRAISLHENPCLYSGNFI